MANLFYSEGDTLSNAVSTNVVDASRFLSYARSECVMQVPNDFLGLSFLRNLPSYIDNYANDIQSIYNSIINVDSTLHNLSDSLIENNHRIDTSTVIKKRERLIK